MEYAEVDGDFDHVPKGGAICLKNRGNVGDRLLSLFFNRLAHQFSAGRVKWAGPSHKDEIAGPPSLGVRATRGRAALRLL